MASTLTYPFASLPPWSAWGTPVKNVAPPRPGGHPVTAGNTAMAFLPFRTPFVDVTDWGGTGVQIADNLTLVVTLVPNKGFATPTTSWVANWAITSPQSAVLLQHEQGHYMINVTVAMDLFNALTGAIQNDVFYDDARARGHVYASAFISRVVAEASDRMNFMNRLYDAITNHGMDVVQQTGWTTFLRNAWITLGSLSDAVRNKFGMPIDVLMRSVPVPQTV
jgi:hypothetical protein